MSAAHNGTNPSYTASALAWSPFVAYGTEFSFHRTGTDAGDADGGADEVVAGGSCEGGHGVLGGTVYTASGIGLFARDGGDVDEMAAPTRNHARHEDLGEDDSGGDVGFKHGHNVLDLVIDDGCDAESQAGVVHKDVHLGKLLGKLIRKSFDSLYIAHVHSDDMNGNLICGSQLAFDVLKSLLSASKQDKLASSLGKSKCTCLPNPRASTSN
eukprot:CAMPEP_0175075850 /NCGR_PEP_ID=MMETSP0052_2-20121109/22320_1 /TAXON_ID=51329 ORGANISM="Polytomella parva, Strain SAG 63-3" /NCGR_SAMPLE_ID=MMETSP0052_2 /ASSEMBLY_ACC=CAM_ASM_000194 /LENGTH=211 /DNA_ID=CAMNT_0016344763 /DNA_START=321 /DNA_END=955 /DNA_ORIENTATION=+